MTSTAVSPYAFTDGLGFESQTEVPAAPETGEHMQSSSSSTPTLDRSVLISGGSRGIGLAVATRLHGQGARVARLSRSLGSAGNDVAGSLIECDVADAESVQLAVKMANEENGPAEVLVANAGITDDKMFLRMDEDSFRTVLDTNLTGTYRLIKAVAGPMLRARWGRIIVVSSVVAMSGSAGQANYAASKAGLIGLTRSLAREFGPRGITVNVIAPGFIETDMTAGLPASRREEVLTNVPLARFGQQAEVADLVAFLAGDAAAYITGAVIPIDGGLGMGN